MVAWVPVEERKMDQNHQLWPLAKEVLRALGQHYYPVMDERAREAGMGECDWYLLLPVLMFDPESVSAAKLLVRVPFYAPHIYENRLKKLTEFGYLKASAPVADGGAYPRFEYNLTESGRMTIQWIIQAADVAMQALHPLSLEDLEHLAGLLQRTVLASLGTPEPSSKWALNLSRKTDHTSVAPVVVRIDQYLTDLNAFRDDCILEAWRKHPTTRDLSPPAWEIFTQLWKTNQVKQDTGYSLEELLQIFDRRGHSPRVYSEALQSMSKLGWVHADKDHFVLTESGYAVRQDAETRIDQLFYEPWKILEPAEIADLKELLVLIWDSLRLRLTSNKVAG